MSDESQESTNAREWLENWLIENAQTATCLGARQAVVEKFGHGLGADYIAGRVAAAREMAGLPSRVRGKYRWKKNRQAVGDPEAVAKRRRYAKFVLAKHPEWTTTRVRKAVKRAYGVGVGQGFLLELKRELAEPAKRERRRKSASPATARKAPVVAAPAAHEGESADGATIPSATAVLKRLALEAFERGDDNTFDALRDCMRRLGEHTPRTMMNGHARKPGEARPV